MKYQYSLLLRLLFALIPINLFYFVFTPLTIYLVYLLLISYSPVVVGNQLSIGQYTFEFIEACVAGSAYYLLLILNILTKDIKLLVRVKMFLFGSLLIYLMNIIRITILILLDVNLGSFWFETVHMVFWEFVMSIYVAAVWIFLVKIYKIKSIPVYNDVKHLLKIIKK